MRGRLDGRGSSPPSSLGEHGPCERKRNEHRHGVGVVPDDLGEAGGWRDGFAVLGHAFEVQGERLLCPLNRIIESGRGVRGGLMSYGGGDTQANRLLGLYAGVKEGQAQGHHWRLTRRGPRVRDIAILLANISDLARQSCCV